jgi:upstream activation factor subunit UAF30
LAFLPDPFSVSSGDFHLDPILCWLSSFADHQISGLYDELTQAGNASDSSEEKPLLNTPSGSQQTAHPPSSVPRPLAKPKVKREPKSEVKASPEIEGEDDEAYARQLQSEFNSYAARPSRASATATRRPKKVVKNNRSAATVDSGDEGEPKPKRAAPNTAFNKDLILRYAPYHRSIKSESADNSDPLSALVNETRLSRPQTVKRIWDYVKARELQDPSDKRYIMCDGPLKEVFHTDRLHMFTWVPPSFPGSKARADEVG